MATEDEASAAAPARDPMAGRGFFPDPVSDRLVAVVLELATELWVALDRIAELEAARSSEGAAEPATRREAADVFIRRIFAPFRDGAGQPAGKG